MEEHQKLKELCILAAGYGTRLGGTTIPKGLIKLKDKEIIRHNVENILSFLNIKRVNIVTNQRCREHYDKFFRSFAKDVDIEFNILLNAHPERGNGFSFSLLSKAVKSEHFLLIMSDHIFSQDFMEEAIGNNDSIGLRVDSDPIYVDYDDATKVCVDEKGRIVKIGKTINPFDYIDTGFFVLPRSIFNITEEMKTLREEFSLSDIIHKARIPVVEVSGKLWIDVDTPTDYRMARRLF